MSAPKVFCPINTRHEWHEARTTAIGFYCVYCLEYLTVNDAREWSYGLPPLVQEPTA